MSETNDYFQDALDRANDLEPHEVNPFDVIPEYNPLRYCYRILVRDANYHEYNVAVRFQLQTWNEQTPITFTDMHTGKEHSIPFFPVANEVELPPDVDYHGEGYQIGESTYWLVPTVHQVKRLNDGELLDRDIAARVITPAALQAGILKFRDQVHEDPNAPAALVELLDVWDDVKASANAAWDDDYPDFEDEEEDDDWDKEWDPDWA